VHHLFLLKMHIFYWSCMIRFIIGFDSWFESRFHNHGQEQLQPLKNVLVLLVTFVDLFDIEYFIRFILGYLLAFDTWKFYGSWNVFIILWFLCRCEAVLHPGFNSTVRIEKNRSKVRHRHKKFGSIAQNNVVYKCHFCAHKNLKRGTPKGHSKKLCRTKDKSCLESTPATKPIRHESSKLEKHVESKDEAGEIHVVASKVVVMDVADLNGMETLPCTSTPTLLDGKKQRRNSSTSKNVIETPSTSSKRRKKSWTSLKEIVQSKECDNSRVADLAMPFFL